ncbi:lamin tail domain-containing protein [Winogradskyella undariae]|uniref:T9SS type A sorting domain-containing protein n=1 Tax=Winogradskyella undariae TaxID=1285465 RepID=UPI00156B36E1|nr:lamin tail domain-containing protein [Winogradskyella undariae]NRR91006.1 lamin tail domain-containing protein [Winogradskyella undariae]
MKNLYPLLIALCLSYTSFAQTTADAWINEIHYDNSGSDIAEGVEIVIADITNYPLDNWSIVLYNGSNGESYGTINYSELSTVTSSVSGFTIGWEAKSDIQNGAPDGLALVYNGTTVVQFLSYEGIITATDGAATGLTSIDIGVQETNTNETPAGTSLQLIDTGLQYSHFSWQPDVTATAGTINTGQTFQLPCYPLLQASDYNTTTPIGTTTATLNWTIGDGDNVLVVVKEGADVDTDPTSGASYTGNTIFSSGDEIGTENYVVYSGASASSVSITGLSEATTYHVAIYEYNTTDTCYNLRELTGSFTTNCTTPTNVSALSAIGGDTTIDLNWTNGTCFDEILIVAKALTAVTVTPTGDGSAYAANASFGAGTDLSLGLGEYVVYKGTETSITVTGLTNSTVYHFKVFTRKGSTWSAGVSANTTPDSVAWSNSIMITEIMINPTESTDVNGEYFEVYNTTDTPIDMNGWIILDTHTDNHTINTSIIVPAYGFAVFGRNATTTENSNVTVNYQYSNIAISNFADEIILLNANGTGIDRVDYGTDATWPDPTTGGTAMIYTGSDIEDNNEGSLWTFATVSEGIDVDFGSPGSNGTDQIVSYLVFVNDAWNTTPSALTSTRTGLIKSNENTSFTLTSSYLLDELYIEEGASLTIDENATLKLNKLILESTSNSYSSLILDGLLLDLDGFLLSNIAYKRFVNSNDLGNDLISTPLFGQTWSDFLSSGTNADDLFDNGATAPTTYAFAPFDKAADDYVNYNSDTSLTIESGKGFRAATDSGTTLTFTGSVLNTDVTMNIEYTGAVHPDWNLIGNPYPSYMNIDNFLNYEISGGIKNIDLLEDASGVYGYDGDAADGYNIITLANSAGQLMTPGQGFLIAADLNYVASHDITFTPSMRTTGNSDDFILGRNANPLTFLKLNASTSNKSYRTEFYFNANSTQGLDPGYDGKVLGNVGSSFALYSHLAQDNTGMPIALQSLNSTDLTNVTIPLGVNTNQGEQLVFSIAESTLPTTVNVYLEDNVANVSTLLNTSDYIITPSSNLLGTGRFYLRITEGILSTIDNSLTELNIYTNKTEKKVVISGQLLEQTTAAIYDIQGRLVMTSQLETTEYSQSIDTHSLSQGIYIVQLQNTTQKKTQKIIIH